METNNLIEAVHYDGSIVLLLPEVAEQMHIENGYQIPSAEKYWQIVNNNSAYMVKVARSYDSNRVGEGFQQPENQPFLPFSELPIEDQEYITSSVNSNQ